MQAKKDLYLAWTLAKRDLGNRYASSYGGVAWNIGVPLLYALINVVVFSLIMKGRLGLEYNEVPFALFYFIPFSLWILFVEVVGRSTSILSEYSYLINKISFPVWVLPLIPFATAFLTQFIIMVMSAGLMVYHGIVPAQNAYLFVLVWLSAVVFTLGIAYFVAAISVYVHDFVQVVPVLTTVLFWLTPILYPSTLVIDEGAFWLRTIIMDLNPFFYLVELSRSVILGTEYFSWSIMGLSFLISIITLITGFVVFRKLKPGFADVL